MELICLRKACLILFLILLFPCSLVNAEDAKANIRKLCLEELKGGEVIFELNAEKCQFYSGTSREFYLSEDKVLKVFTKEFGENFINGVDGVDSTNYAVYIEGLSHVTELGKFTIVFYEEDNAVNLFNVASKRQGFQTKKIATLYTVKRDKKTVMLYYREGAFPIASRKSNCERNDIECQVLSIIELNQQKNKED